MIALIVLFVIIVNLWPKPRNKVVVNAGGERIERVYLAMCGREFKTHFRPGGVEGEYWGGCATGPTLKMESATAKYVCAEDGGYNDSALPPLLTRYRIADGQCRYVDEQFMERR